MEQQLAAAREQKERYINNRAREARERLTAVQQDISTATRQLASAVRRRLLVVLRSPANGIVLALGQRSIGLVAKEAELLVTLVPRDNKIEAAADVDSSDVARLRVNDPVRVKFDALHYQRHGPLNILFPNRVGFVRGFPLTIDLIYLPEWTGYTRAWNGRLWYEAKNLSSRTPVRDQGSVRSCHRHIRTREANGRELTYLQGWYAISEANRIFGFDGWSRETTKSRCVLARENRGSFLAIYIARVRVTVQAGWGNRHS